MSRSLSELTALVVLQHQIFTLVLMQITDYGYWFCAASVLALQCLGAAFVGALTYLIHLIFESVGGSHENYLD